MTDVAVKVCQGQPSAADLKTFGDETQLMMSLRPHRNVVQLRGVCQNPLCVVIDFVGGGALESRLHDLSKPVEWPHIFQWARGICAGMLHIHLEGIVHRDLASRNVLLDSRDEALIADFGLSAQTFGVSGNETREMGFFRGPYKWMAPESLQANQFSVKSDVWSFGVTLWEMLSRHLPFEERTIYQVKDEVVRVKLRLPMSPKWPETWRNLLVACFRTDPAMRPDMQTLGTWLDQMYKDLEEKKDPAYNVLPALSDAELPKALKPTKTGSTASPPASATVASTHVQQNHHQPQHFPSSPAGMQISSTSSPSVSTHSPSTSLSGMMQSTSIGSYEPPKPVVEEEKVNPIPASTSIPAPALSTSLPPPEATSSPAPVIVVPASQSVEAESQVEKSDEEIALERRLGLTVSSESKATRMRKMSSSDLTIAAMKQVGSDSVQEDKK